MKKIVITCPSNMSDETYEYICGGFREHFGDDTVFEKIVDPELIGGFTAVVGNKIYDISIKTQMDMLKKHMSGD